MIGLDTNVLVRYLVQDDPGQGAAAATFIARTCTSDEPAYLNTVVLSELTWVLSRPYDYRRDQIADVLDKLLRAAQLRFEDPPLIWDALNAYRSGSADMADCLIGAINAKGGCATTVTFDKKAARLTDFTLLDA
ncbi:MAG: type II toxin-antitoxin system VapC family toxin [Alphaproteobacteria bacterium]